MVPRFPVPIKAKRRFSIVWSSFMRHETNSGPVPNKVAAPQSAGHIGL
ncbi:putative predicted protein [Rhizobium favelukesii]|uniref:Uncharacterized protein n=1 Tax=Rhizobium favelukesii TaxID=348824 RepID=W6R3D9_9HYPH|nr:putative predicted protein [Rhizobium favelukesii]